MRIFFSVGEPSGDLHASNLIRHLKSQDPTIECVGYGGPKMKAAGCELHFDLTQLAIMFLWDALKKVFTFRGLARDAENYFRAHKVDAVVLIDYPGFNWWIAKRARKQGIPVYFYGVPQMWAWGPWRIKKIRKWVDHVLCKLPFEVEWFNRQGCHATYVGHPYFDQLVGQEFDKQFMSRLRDNAEQKLLTLLPGSRDLEIENHLPMLLKAARLVLSKVENTKVVVACYNDKQFRRSQQILADHPANVEMFVDRTPELMKSADACLACSGSVSLELMYHHKPTVIVYKPSRLFMFLQTWFLNIKYITLVNLIDSESIERKSRRVYDPDGAGANAVMPEYLTIDDKSEQMANQIIRWFQDPEALKANSARLAQLANQYAEPGATERAADYILASSQPLSYKRLDSPPNVVFADGVLDKVAETGFEGISNEKAA